MTAFEHHQVKVFSLCLRLLRHPSEIPVLERLEAAATAGFLRCCVLVAELVFVEAAVVDADPHCEAVARVFFSSSPFGTAVG
jgi:hypothetical protein